MKPWALVPAAGRGSRLGIDVPKVFAPLAGRTLWEVLRDKLRAHVERLVLVLSPDGLAYAQRHLAADADVTLAVQSQPLGMGDAIFGCEPVWREARDLLVVWGDQVFVSQATLASTLAAHGTGLTMPTVKLPRPYVEYRFQGDRLMEVLQAREGDVTGEHGWSDVGTFLLQTDGLLATWTSYLMTAQVGKGTGEVNFLPFLPYLSQQGWPCRRVAIADPDEARGVNTPDDLAYFAARLAQ